MTLSIFRCVRDNSKSGTKYPYLIKSADGVTVVSRDANGGVDPSMLLASGDSRVQRIRLHRNSR